MWKRFEWTGKAKKRTENDELDPKSWSPFLLRNVFLSTFLKRKKKLPGNRSCLHGASSSTVKTGLVKAWLTFEPPIICLTCCCASCAQETSWLIVIIVKTHIHNKKVLRFPPPSLPPAILFEVTVQQYLWLCPRSHHAALWAEMLCWKLLGAKGTT